MNSITWPLVSMGEVAEFKNGLNYEGSAVGSGLKMIGVSDFGNNRIISYDKLKQLSGFSDISDEYLLRENDLLFVRSNGNRALVGRAMILKEVYEPITHSGFTIRARIVSTAMVPDFVSHLFTSDFIRKQYQESGTGTNISNLSQALLSGILIPRPPVQEQMAIAKMLSLWESATDLADRLIVAKQNRRRWLMQQLLTGKKRLPGLAEPWQTVHLGEVFENRAETNRPDLPLVAITGENGVVSRDALDRRDTSSEDKGAYLRICPGDIGYNTMRMWQGVCGLSRIEGIVSPAYTIVTPRDGIDGEFMALLFKSPAAIHLFHRHSQGLVKDTLNLKWRHFAEIKVQIPEKSEQQAIAHVFQTADRELALLRAQLDALREQKKGLMQKLLTGEVRVGVSRR